MPIPTYEQLKPMVPQPVCQHPVTEVLRDHVTGEVYYRPSGAGLLQLRWCKRCDRTWWELAE